MYKKLGADEYYGQILNQPPVKEVVQKVTFWSRCVSSSRLRFYL